MKKSFIFTVFLLLVSHLLTAQDYHHNWSHTHFDSILPSGYDIIANPVYDISTQQGRDITTDRDGNVITLTDWFGTFYDTANFSVVYQSDEFDIIVEKRSPEGELIWTKYMEAEETQHVWAVATDKDNNIYFCGWTEDTLDLDPGAGTFLVEGPPFTERAFLAKWDENGDFVYGRVFASTGDCRPYGLSLDAQENIYLSGTFRGTIDLDPGNGTSSHTANGQLDAFFVKLDDSGNFDWDYTFGGGSYDYVYDHAVDEQGNVYLTGGFSGTVDFDAGSGTHNISASGSADGFLLKVTNEATFDWAHTAGSSSNWEDFSGVAYREGFVYISGYFYNSINLGSGGASTILNNSGSGRAAFVQKLDTTAVSQWGYAITGSGSEAWDVQVAQDGNVLLCGDFGGTVDFEYGSGTSSAQTNGGADAYVLSVSAAGDYNWHKTWGDTDLDWFIRMHLDTLDNFYGIGIFARTVDMDPDTGEFILEKPYGDYAKFAVKMSSCRTFGGTSASACESYLSPSGNHTWTSSGQYLDTIANAAGCDSVLTIDLTIHNSTHSEPTVTSCGPYTSPSGNYTWTETGQYMDTIANAMGCDSVMTIDLLIPVIDTGLVVTNDTITVIHQGASYQWVDCSDGFAPIAGETNAQFIATEDGSYAAVITEDGCSDTTTCIMIEGLGVKGAPAPSLSLFPNPASDQVMLSTPTTTTTPRTESQRLVIYNALGEVILDQVTLLPRVIPTAHWKPGMYFIQAGDHRIERLIISP